ncbi:MAG: hypothetical protein INR62_07405 [Rhodospirillales bacterium]|nr:hypothetical protein [Acetobacter sp.]
MSAAKGHVLGKLNRIDAMHHLAYQNNTGFFPKRIKRAAFLSRGIALILVSIFAGILFNASEHANVIFKIIGIGVGAALLLFVLVAMFRSLFMPRLVDMGVHPAWSLLFLVHALSGLFLLALLLIPSDAFAKRRYID